MLLWREVPMVVLISASAKENEEMPFVPTSTKSILFETPVYFLRIHFLRRLILSKHRKDRLFQKDWAHMVIHLPQRGVLVCVTALLLKMLRFMLRLHVLFRFWVLSLRNVSGCGCLMMTVKFALSAACSGYG